MIRERLIGDNGWVFGVLLCCFVSFVYWSWLISLLRRKPGKSGLAGGRGDAAADIGLQDGGPGAVHRRRVFVTHAFGDPTVFVTDPDANRTVLQNEAKPFECSCPSSICNLLGRHSLLLMKGCLHKKIHSLTMSFANSSIISDHLLPGIDRLVRCNVASWEGRIVRLLDETKEARREVVETFTSIVEQRSKDGGFKGRKKDMLAALIESEQGFSEEEMVDFLLALLVDCYETTSTIMTLAIKFLSENPLALSHLKQEHEGILEEKEKKKKHREDMGLDWSDCKSMPFTQCVINETLRVANIISGVFRGQLPTFTDEFNCEYVISYLYNT